jgi:hypothetical protein
VALNSIDMQINAAITALTERKTALEAEVKKERLVH